MNMNRYLASGLSAVLTLFMVSFPPARADVIIDWNETALSLITNNQQVAIQAARTLAIVNIAMYDAVNALGHTNEVFRVAATPRQPCARAAAAAVAAQLVLRALFTNATATLDAALAISLAAVAEGAAKSNGMFLGQYVGDQVLIWRGRDAAALTNPAPYVPGTNAGDWRPTFPDYSAALLPHWAALTPFALSSSNQFRCRPPPALTSAAYTAAFDEVKAYSNNVAWTNADYPNIVWFWDDRPGTITTVGRWNRIAQSLGTNNDLQANARLYCLLNVALAEAGLSAWETKYNYNRWRPISAIRAADTDGNPATLADTNWTPYVTNTPAAPAYVSEHSVFSAAAAAVLSNFFGSDSNAFTVPPYNALASARSYTNFSAAAQEAGRARILAGVQFRDDHTNGLQAGYEIGNYLSRNFLRVPPSFVPDTDGIDTDGDGNVSNDYVNIQLAAGDGFAKGADGYDFYCFGFSDVTGVRLEDVMARGMLAAEISAPTIQLKEGQRVYLQLSNVGMLMRPDLFDPHTVHFHGFPNAASIFDGEPMASLAINMGGTLTYYYQIVEPGTYLYHCHVEATEHMEMGMIGNLYVAPIQNNYTNGTILPGGFVHSNGFTYAYNDEDGSTKYDVDYPIQLNGFDRNFHAQHIAVQPLPFSQLKSDYPLINGRGYPDTINSGYISNLNGYAAQKTPALITAAAGQKILLRVSNVDIANFHTFTVLGIPMKVVGRSGRLLRGPDPDGAGPLRGKDLYYYTSSVTLGGGEACEILLDTAGLAPGAYLFYATNLADLSNGPEDYGGLMTEIIIQ